MGLTVKVRGMDEVLAMLERAQEAPAKVDALKQSFAFGAHRNVIRLAPVDTGFLKASNVVIMAGPVITFLALANYSPYQELGTGHRGGASYRSFPPLPDEPVAYATYWPGCDAQPFMRPGVAEALKVLEREVDEVAKDVAEGVAIRGLRGGFE
jgi:hypothetical protein